MGLGKSRCNIPSDTTQGCFRHLDFSIPLCLTHEHDRYILVMIEHFSKWLELVSLLDRNNERVTYIYLDNVLISLGL
jgi:hypothetical protein